MAGISVRGLDALGQVLTGEAQHLAEVMRTIEDVSPRAVGVWDVGETMAHVAAGPGHALAVIRGELAPVSTCGYWCRTAGQVDRAARLRRCSDRANPQAARITARGRPLWWCARSCAERGPLPGASWPPWAGRGRAAQLAGVVPCRRLPGQSLVWVGRSASRHCGYPPDSRTASKPASRRRLTAVAAMTQ